MGGMDQTAWTWGKNYSELTGLTSHFLFARSDEKKFLERYKRSRLLKAYRDGEVWSAQEYQKVDEAGNIGWFMDLVNLVRDAETGDICMYAFGMDSQLRHDWEKLAEGEVQRDSVTGFYVMNTARDIVKALLKKQKENGQCALSLIRIMGGERSRDTQRFMAAVLSMALGMDSVVGQYSQDIILVFIPETGSRFDVKRRIEDAFAYIRLSMTDIPELSGLRFMAGTVTGQGGEADFDEMLAKAGLLCDIGNDLAVDTVLFPAEEEDWSWSGLRREAGEDEIIIIGDEAERLLNREEQTAAFNCVTDMLAANSLDTSLTDTLRELGRFYNAARTYILRVAEDRQSVDMVYEWTCREKQSIRHVMQDIKMKKIPLIKNCYQEGKPLIMENPPSISQHTKDRGKWRFAAYPLKEKDKITGFLCVENAKKHLGDTALLSVLAPYVIGEKQRFQNMAVPVLDDGQDALTRLPNLSSYKDVVYSLDSDSYSSMGVMSLDIPNYSAINSSYGFEYGKKMLLFIADMLTTVFGKTYIFRTWDAEFAVLFPDVVQEVFTGHCTRLRAMIQRRYPGQVRMGYVWAEGIFSARHMVREAQTIMRNENVKEPDVEWEGAPGGESRKSKVSINSFVPYFQPKIDMRDGRLVGAEAVVRKVEEDGSIIPPTRFVDSMEQNGSIRELDLFMLDLVLQQMREWKKKKYPLPPVSINISRVTLFHSSALASVLDIQSRYPEISAGQIELEITETAEGAEKATLAEIVERFRQCGIQFELDDFGSGYANISMFSNINFSAVKLDRSLINDLPDNEISSMMVENVTQICRTFGMQCIAEGVETRQQAEALLKAGCVYGQGYYYSKPLSAHEFEKRYFLNNCE